jgi:hypothetical protein
LPAGTACLGRSGLDFQARPCQMHRTVNFTPGLTMTDAPTQRPRSLRFLLALLILLVALLAAALVWWVAGGGGKSEDEAAKPPQFPGAARIVSPAELREAAAASSLPIYWAGERPGTELELSETGEVRAYVRYLTGGTAAGDPKSAYLTIGAYKLPNALAALQANARRTDTALRKTPRGAQMWVDPNSPTSVYLARPGEGFQVEVYDPDPKTALRVALSGDVRPVAGS